MVNFIINSIATILAIIVVLIEMAIPAIAIGIGIKLIFHISVSLWGIFFLVFALKFLRDILFTPEVSSK